jgi:hypothetical protein
MCIDFSIYHPYSQRKGKPSSHTVYSMKQSIRRIRNQKHAQTPSTYLGQWEQRGGRQTARHIRELYPALTEATNTGALIYYAQHNINQRGFEFKAFAFNLVAKCTLILLIYDIYLTRLTRQYDFLVSLALRFK